MNNITGTDYSRLDTVTFLAEVDNDVLCLYLDLENIQLCSSTYNVRPNPVVLQPSSRIRTTCLN
jgi:hypothetical protein